jgi:hypothetical protein
MGIAPHKTYLGRQLEEQRGCNRRIIGVGDSQLCRQRYPDRANGDSQMEFPTIPPTMPARFAPTGLRVNAAVRNFTAFSMFLMPHPTPCLEGSAVHRRGASMLPKRSQFFNQASPQATYQVRQTFWQRFQSAFPGAPAWKLTLCLQQFAQVLADSILLLEEGQQGTSAVQTADNHDD